MPISKSAKKALRVSNRKASVNRHRKALVKEALKNVDGKTINKAVSMIAPDKEGLSRAFSAIDKGVKWGTFHANKAARLKSQLSKKIDTKPAKEKTATKAKSKTAVKAKKAPSKTKKS
ncbi:MAG: 30S ribosomal protein S20 [Patescibacteria group bacterium]